MAGNASPIFVGVPRNTGIKLSTTALDVNGSGSTVLFTADATNGSRVHAISATPAGELGDTVVARLFLNKSGTYYLLSEKAIAAYTVVTDVPAPTTSFLEYGDMPFIDPSDRFLTLGPGDSLTVSLLRLPDSAIHFICHGGDY
jgi:hypothetical protein